MHDQRKPEPNGSGPSNESLDLYDQGVVLIHITSNYPAQFRMSDLIRELTRDPENFEERDRIERAVRDLIAAGLLFRCEALVLPTRSALHFDRLVREDGA